MSEKLSEEEVLSGCRAIYPALFQHGLKPQEKDGPATKRRMTEIESQVRAILAAARDQGRSQLPAVDGGEPLLEAELRRVSEDDRHDERLVAKAERLVGRWVYERIEALMEDAEPGTAEGAELEYLSSFVDLIETHGAGPWPPGTSGVALALSSPLAPDKAS